MSLSVPAKRRLGETFGLRVGPELIAEFNKLDATGGGVGTVASTHQFLGGPPTGAQPAPSTFRALVTSDMPGALTPISLAVSGQCAFYGQALAVQPTAGHVTVLTGAGSTSAVFANSTFTGGTGASAYSVGDLVLALKQLGLIAL